MNIYLVDSFSNAIYAITNKLNYRRQSDNQRRLKVINSGAN